MAEIENVKILQVDTEPSIKAVKDLKKTMKELDNQFVAGKISEKEYLKQTIALEQAVFGVTEAHKDARLALNDFGVQMKNVAQIGKTASAGLTAVQAGMNAIGLESEGVAEKISNLQNLQALTQSFEALGDSGPKALKAIKIAFGDAETSSKAAEEAAKLTGQTTEQAANGAKKALIGMGLGVIILLVGELVAHFEEVDTWLKEVTGGVVDLGKWMDGLKGVFENIIPTLNSFGSMILSAVTAPVKSYIELLKGVGTIIKDVFTGNWDSIADDAEKTKEAMLEPYREVRDEAKEFGNEVSEGWNAGVQKGIDEENAKLEQQRKEERAKRQKEAEDRLKEYEKRLTTELELEKSQKDDSWQKTQEYKDKMTQYYADLEKQYKAVYGKESDEYKQLQIKKNEFFKNYLTQEEIDAQEAAQKQKEIEEQKVKDREALLKSLSDYQKGEEQVALDELQEQYNKELELIGDNEEAKLILKKKYDDEVKAIHDKYLKEQKTTEEETSEEVTGVWKNATEEKVAILQKSMSYAQGFAGATMDILNSLADAQDTSTREGFESQKKLQIASATIQMLTGIATAIAGTYTTHTGVWDIALAASQAAAIGVSGAIQIAKIKQQKFDGGSGSSSSSVPSINVNAAEALNNASLNTRTAISDSEQESALKSTKVYVTESDIADTTTKVNVMESENSI